MTTKPTTIFATGELVELVHLAARIAHIDTTRRGWMAEIIKTALRVFIALTEKIDY